MDPSRSELDELGEQIAALRAALERVRNELAVATATTDALGDKLRGLGVVDTEDVKTLVDGVSRAEAKQRTAATIPGRRVARSPPSLAAMVKAGVVGASLSIGTAIVVLLIVQLTRRPDAAPAPRLVVSAQPAASAVVSVASRDILPPPAVTSVAADPPSLASAVVPKASPPVQSNLPTIGTLTVVCSPKCDSITDNGLPLATTSPQALPVAVGQHKLILSTASGVKRTIVTTVMPGQLREVHVSMETSASAPTYDRGF